MGLIIPLAGFRCHTVWEVGGGWRGSGQGQRRRGVVGALIPRCAVSMLVGFDLRVKATVQPRLFLIGIYPACFSFAGSWMLLCSWLQNLKLQARDGGQWVTSLVKQKAETDMDANKTHLCVFTWRLRQWLFRIFNWKGDMAPHGNPSVQNWYLNDSCPLISIAEQAWDFQALFHLFQVIEM